MQRPFSSSWMSFYKFDSPATPLYTTWRIFFNERARVWDFNFKTISKLTFCKVDVHWYTKRSSAFLESRTLSRVLFRGNICFTLLIHSTEYSFQHFFLERICCVFLVHCHPAAAFSCSWFSAFEQRAVSRLVKPRKQFWKSTQFLLITFRKLHGVSLLAYP